jgi:hypothetical protein
MYLSLLAFQLRKKTKWAVTFWPDDIIASLCSDKTTIAFWACAIVRHNFKIDLDNCKLKIAHDKNEMQKCLFGAKLN